MITHCEQEAQCTISAKKRNRNDLDIISLYVPFTIHNCPGIGQALANNQKTQIP